MYLHDHWVGMARRAKERSVCTYMTTGWAWQGEQMRGVYVLTHDHWVGMTRRAKERCVLLTHDHWVGMARRTEERCVCTYTRPLGGHDKESKGEVCMYLHTTTGWI